jgi:hypothetical protein
MIIDVQEDNGMVSIARILYEDGDILGVQFLRKINNDTYDFNIQVEHIDKATVCGFYDTEELETTGLYKKTLDGRYESADDSDYELDEEDLISDSESITSLDSEY